MGLLDRLKSWRRKGNLTPLQSAVLSSSTFRLSKDKVRRLIDEGVDVNARMDSGWTPLHLVAIHTGDVEVAEWLLTGGAMVNAVDNDGATPLHRAAENGHEAMIEWLVNEGATVNAKDRRGMTPVDFADAMGHKKAASTVRLHGGRGLAETNADIIPQVYAERKVDPSLEPLQRCGSCGGTTKLVIRNDNKGNRGCLCTQCDKEYQQWLSMKISNVFWMCGICGLRVVSSSKLDAEVDRRGNVCPECGTSLKVSLLNLRNDRAVQRA